MTLLLFSLLNPLLADWKQECHYYSQSVSNIFSSDHQKDLWLAGAIMLPAGILLDHALQPSLSGLYHENISEIGDIYGHRVGYFAVVSGMIIHDLAIKKPLSRSLAEIRLVAESVLVGQVVIEVLKSITHRQRPDNSTYRSFPSGHAGGAFGLATALQAIYGKSVGIPAYSMAFFVASSRINDNKHYFSDVLAGGLIGVMVARGFTANFNKQWTISPQISCNQICVNWIYNF